MTVDHNGALPPRIIPVGEEPPPSGNGRQRRQAREGREPKGKRAAAARFQCVNAFIDATMADLTPTERAVWLILWRDTKPNGLAATSQASMARRAGVTGRAEAQVLRLSMVYTLLDGKCIVEEDHLRAVLALWSYADASARLIFGAEPENPLISLVLAKPQGGGAVGLTRTDLHNAFSLNIPAANLLEALAKVRDRGDGYSERMRTGKPGAPAERWFARRSNEGSESTQAADSRPAAEGIDSLDSFVRRPSPDAATGGEEVVTL